MYCLFFTGLRHSSSCIFLHHSVSANHHLSVFERIRLVSSHSRHQVWQITHLPYHTPSSSLRFRANTFSIILFKTSSLAYNTPPIPYSIIISYPPFRDPSEIHAPLHRSNYLNTNTCICSAIRTTTYSRVLSLHICTLSSISRAVTVRYSNVVKRTFHTSSTSTPRVRYTFSAHVGV
jgi:hypothetical protein